MRAFTICEDDLLTIEPPGAPAGAVRLRFEVEVDGEVRHFDYLCVLARGAEPLSWTAQPYVDGWPTLFVLTFKAASEEADAALRAACEA